MNTYDFHIQKVENLPEEFLRHWRRLALTGNQADPVCCGPAWQLAWQDIRKEARRIWWGATEDSLAVFTLHLEVAKPLMFFPPENSWFFGNTVIGPDGPELLEIMLKDIGSRMAGLPQAVFLGACQKNSPDWQNLRKNFGSSWSFYPQDSFHNAAASLAGGIDGWLSRRSANFRQKLKKTVRRALSAGIGFEVHCPRDDAEVTALYRRMIAVESRSWKGLSGTGICMKPMDAFYYHLMKRLAPDGNAQVMFARHEDQDIGYIFGSTLGPIYRGQQFSYIDEWASWSIGNLMQYVTICGLCDAGFERYDMGAADGRRMAYKSHWTEMSHEGRMVLMGPAGIPICSDSPQDDI